MSDDTDKIALSISNIRNAIAPMGLNLGWMHQQVLNLERDAVYHEALDALVRVKSECDKLEQEFKNLVAENQRLRIELLTSDE